MATSRFQNLRAALVTKITTQLTTDTITGVTVWPYRPVTGEREDAVWLGNIRGDQEPYTQGPNGLRDETMEVDVAIVCPTHGATAGEFGQAEQRAEAVMASIEEALRDDITVGSTVWNVEFDSYETKHTFDDQGAIGVVDITITAEAHI